MYNFNDIVGNENIIGNLKSAIYNKSLAHSYILNGPSKSCKETIARCFAKLIFCEKSNTQVCGNCQACINFNNFNNPDLIYVKGAKAKLGIDEVREQIIKNVQVKPFKYEYKIFIIKDAHTMTIQAQNAILKTIEEPPKFAIFIFLSENYNLFLPTILSRCVLFKIRPLSNSLVENYLIKNKDLNITEKDAKIYAEYSEGSIGKAIEISKSADFLEFRLEIINYIETLDEKNIIEMYRLVEVFENYKENIQTILDIFLLTYRDTIIYKQFKNFGKTTQKDIKTTIENLAKNSIKRLIRNIELVLKYKEYLNRNTNFNNTIECLFLKLKEK